MNSSNETKLPQIFRYVLGLSGDTDVSEIMQIREVRWDSLATVTLVAALESEFHLRLDSRDIERLTSYQSTLLLLMEKQQ